MNCSNFQRHIIACADCSYVISAPIYIFIFYFQYVRTFKRSASNKRYKHKSNKKIKAFTSFCLEPRFESRFRVLGRYPDTYMYIVQGDRNQHTTIQQISNTTTGQHNTAQYNTIQHNITRCPSNTAAQNALRWG